MTSADNPWLRIPAADYEGHMEAVGQTAALRQLFSAAYGRVKPRRLAVLGCTTGADFDAIDSAVTDVAVGVDINADYLHVAEERLTAAGRHVDLICGDVLTVGLPQAPFDLVHAALLLEYVDPARLFRRFHHWAAPSGRISIILQQEIPGIAAVSTTRYESLQTLAGTMSLRSAEQIAAIGAEEGLACESSRAVQLPSGKILVQMLFERTTERPLTAPRSEPARRE
jgi:SAM-dependent methyltransferase